MAHESLRAIAEGHGRGISCAEAQAALDQIGAEGLAHAVKVHGAHVSCRNKVLLFDGEWRVFKRIESETTGAVEDIFWYPDFLTEEAAVAELTCVR